MTLKTVIETGQRLIEDKARLPHGSFTGHVKAHYQIGQRTARRWMQLFRKRSLLAKLHVTDLTTAYFVLSHNGQTDIETLLKDYKAGNGQTDIKTVTENHEIENGQADIINPINTEIENGQERSGRYLPMVPGNTIAIMENGHSDMKDGTEITADQVRQAQALNDQQIDLLQDLRFDQKAIAASITELKLRAAS